MHFFNQQFHKRKIYFFKAKMVFIKSNSVFLKRIIENRNLVKVCNSKMEVCLWNTSTTIVHKRAKKQIYFLNALR